MEMTRRNVLLGAVSTATLPILTATAPNIIVRSKKIIHLPSVKPVVTRTAQWPRPRPDGTIPPLQLEADRYALVEYAGKHRATLQPPIYCPTYPTCPTPPPTHQTYTLKSAHLTGTLGAPSHTRKRMSITCCKALPDTRCQSTGKGGP